MGRLFGTDGARGVAVTELTCERAMNIGRAAALVLSAKSGKGKRPLILIGKDTRISSDTLEAALIAGITSVGADAELLGVVPTPAVAFLVKEYEADAGVMISASHNSVEYNGIKLFAGNGMKLPDELEEEIEALVLDRPHEMALCEGLAVGRIRSMYSAVNDYINFVQGAVKNRFDGFRVLIDCANGSASSTAASIFEELGAECEFTANRPSGTNINESCGSTHIEGLCERVKAGGFRPGGDFRPGGGYRLGVAFDGDADRCLAVDEAGGLVDGDKIIAIMARHMKKQGRLAGNTAVVTVMSGLGFHEYMRENGMDTLCTKVGDRYVLEEMLKNGYRVGGEQSGHIIFSEYAGTGDGQLTAALLMDMLVETGASLATLAAEIPDYPQVNIAVNITPEQKAAWEADEGLKAAVREAELLLEENGRILVRASGTEPLIRVMTEGRDGELVKNLAEKVAQKIKSL